MVKAGLALLAALAVAGPAHAAEHCRLALLLALDVSSSVDEAEDRLQRQGLAAALLSPEVQRAIFEQPNAPVALSVYEWSGRYQQSVVLDWVILRGPADIVGAAETIARSPRSFEDFPTAMGYGIGYAAKRFDAAPPCFFRTLDISGDGITNDGFEPRLAFKYFPLDGVIVNGLVIGGGDDDAGLLTYYHDEVIRGPGAFVEFATDYSDFERAMRRKLEREMRAQVIGALDPEVIR